MSYECIQRALTAHGVPSFPNVEPKELRKLGFMALWGDSETKRVVDLLKRLKPAAEHWNDESLEADLLHELEVLDYDFTHG